MTNSSVPGMRNQSIECFRLFASFLVVLLHSNLPGATGTVISSVSRIAVPFFFVVSGFFSYQACEVKIKKQLLNVFLLWCIATTLYVVYYSFLAYQTHGQTFLEWFSEKLPLYKLFPSLLTNDFPFAMHLWYLGAITYCYAAFLLYTKFCDGTTYYRPLYYISIPLFSLFILMDSFLPVIYQTVEVALYRNAFLLGFPMFSFGLFLREYHNKLLRVFHLTKHKLHRIALEGILLSLLQCYSAQRCELPLGILLTLFAVFLLCLQRPQLTAHPKFSFFISRFGKLSAFIYVTHFLYLSPLSPNALPFFITHFGDSTSIYIHSVVVFLFSLSTGILWDFLCSLFRKSRHPDSRTSSN